MKPPPHLEIRKLTVGDARRLLQFYERLPAWIVRWFEPFPQVTAEKLMEHVNQAEDGKAISVGLFAASTDILGHAFILETASGKPVLGCGLDESVIGKGFGRRLMQAVVEEADRQQIPMVTLTVFKDNARARRLYESFGFVAVGDAACREPGDSQAMERVHGGNTSGARK